MNKLFFENIYRKYVISLNSKKLIAYKSKFKNSFNLWIHGAYNNDWSLESYQKIYNINNISSFWKVFNNHYDLLDGMYFFMKNNINPIYEDTNNINGGYWSIKININDAFNTWLYLCMDLISGNLDKKNIVNGLSICNKRKFYIIKIWIKNHIYNDINNININIKSINTNTILFNKFLN